MEFAWNTQKNKMNDVKGKDMEQERKGRKSNPDIDDTRTNMNYDLVESFHKQNIEEKNSAVKYEFGHGEFLEDILKKFN